MYEIHPKHDYELVRYTPFGTYLIHTSETEQDAERMRRQIGDIETTKVRKHRCSAWAVKQCGCDPDAKY